MKFLETHLLSVPQVIYEQPGITNERFQTTFEIKYNFVAFLEKTMDLHSAFLLYVVFYCTPRGIEVANSITTNFQLNNE